MGVRYKDDNGTWGDVLFQTIHIYDANPSGGGEDNATGFATIAAAEYFVDVDPGEGNATAFQPQDGAFDSEVESILPEDFNSTGLAEGPHLVGVRYQDDNGTWGDVLFQTIHIYDANPEVGGGEGNATGFAIIVAAEWFVGTDPGEGNATDFEPSDDGFDSEVESVLPTELSTAGFAVGAYLVGVRYQDNEGTWGDVLFATIEVSVDTDGDGLLDAEELAQETNATNPDSDGDGVWDGDETLLGFDPLDENATPVVHTYNVTVANGIYYVDGVHRPVLRLAYDKLHRFVLDGNTTLGHPFHFSNDEHGGDFAEEITSGVRNSRAISGTVTLAAHRGLPDYFFYQCGAHPDMGNLVVLGEDYFSGLVGHWAFDETNGTIAHDSSGNDRNGTLAGFESNATSWTTGKLGGALDFDGTNDSVNVGAGAPLDDLGPKTLSAWVYRRGIGYVMSKRSGGDGYWRLAVEEANTGWFRDFSDSAHASAQGPTFTDNEWHLLTLTWDGGAAGAGASIYVDGEEVTNSRTDGTGALLSDAANTFNIGSRGGTEAFFNGLIDDVRVYDRALTAGQVHALFESATRDHDGDGITDEAELAADTDPTNPDTDGDGASDGAEVAAGTDPHNPDSDGDGFSDGEEIAAGTNPKDAASVINQAPSDVTLFPSVVLENQPAGTIVGELNATDPDSNGTITFALIAGDGDIHNELFSIDANGSLRTNQPLDEESGAWLQIRIRATDDENGSAEQPFDVLVFDDSEEDADGDGLPEFYEDFIGTSDLNPDSDGDGSLDGEELTFGSHPDNNASYLVTLSGNLEYHGPLTTGVITWGDGEEGGDSFSVAGQLSDGVVEIFSTEEAFAALKTNGSVVTWGDDDEGGSSSEVAEHLSGGVVNIFSTEDAFAALKEDGSVVTWGDTGEGGDSAEVASQLQGGVVEIFSTEEAFAALKEDGSVVTWGNPEEGGDSFSVATQLQGGVLEIFSTDEAFAALKEGGSVVTWGDAENGGDSSAVAFQMQSGVVEIFSNEDAFAALKADGSVVAWGIDDYGGDSSSVSSHLQGGVLEVFSTDGAFAALKTNGSVITWGSEDWGGDSSSVSSQLQGGVVAIFSHEDAFAALKQNGSVVTWGWAENGGDSTSVASQLTGGVVEVFSTEEAFAALKADGSVVTWGDPDYGGDSSLVAHDLQDGVSNLVGTRKAFAALKTDGSVVTWGDPEYGGDSTPVAWHLSGGIFEIYANDYAFAALGVQDRFVIQLEHTTTGAVTEIIRPAPGHYEYLLPNGESYQVTAFHDPNNNEVVDDWSEYFGAEARGTHATITTNQDLSGIDVKLWSLQLSNGDVLENQPAGTIVGHLQPAYADGIGPVTYAFAEGLGDDHNGLFSIDANGIVRTAAPLDMESLAFPIVRVRATREGNASIEQRLTLVTLDDDQEDADGDGLLEFQEDQLGTSDLHSDSDGDGMTDPEEVSFGSNPDDNASFSVTLSGTVSYDGATDGQIRVFAVAGFGGGVTIEMNDSYGDGWNGSVLTIADDSNASVFEGTFEDGHQHVGTAQLGTGQSYLVTVTPGQYADEVTWKILFDGEVLAEGEAPTSVNFITPFGSSSEMVLTQPGPYQFVLASNSHYQVAAFVDSNSDDFLDPLEPAGFHSEEPLLVLGNLSGIDIEILDNAAPIGFQLSANSVTENAVPGTIVGSFTVTDPDDPNGSGYYYFDLVDGEGSEDNQRFAIEGKHLLSISPDFEIGPVHDIRVRVSDSRGAAFEKNLVISVVDDPLDNVIHIPGSDFFAQDAAKFDRFGDDLSFSGNLLAVAASRADLEDNKTDAGAVYLYRMETDGSASSLSKVTAPDASTDARFGSSLDLSGDLLVVGAPDAGQESNSSHDGAAYLYRVHPNGSVAFLTKLSNPNTGGGSDSFGETLSVSGNLLAVGNSRASLDYERYFTGAVYLYRVEENGSATYLSQVMAPDASRFDFFGSSLSLSGDLLAVGAPNVDAQGAEVQSHWDTGAVYLYRLESNGSADLLTKLTVPDGAGHDRFGFSVTQSGNLLAVGADGVNESGRENVGSVYLYRLEPDGNATFLSQVTPRDATENYHFGQEVSFSDGLLAVGVIYADHQEQNSVGAVYLYRLEENGSVATMGKLVSPSDQSYGHFGSSVGQSQSHLAAGIVYSNLSGVSSAGATYVFHLDGLEGDLDGDEILNYLDPDDDGDGFDDAFEIAAGFSYLDSTSKPLPAPASIAGLTIEYTMDPENENYHGYPPYRSTFGLNGMVLSGMGESALWSYPWSYSRTDDFAGNLLLGDPDGMRRIVTLYFNSPTTGVYAIQNFHRDENGDVIPEEPDTDQFDIEGTFRLIDPTMTFSLDWEFEENFSGDSFDEELWIKDFDEGESSFSQEGGKLSFVFPGSEEGYSWIDLISSRPLPLNEDWILEAELFRNESNATTEAEVGIFLEGASRFRDEGFALHVDLNEEGLVAILKGPHDWESLDEVKIDLDGAGAVRLRIRYYEQERELFLDYRKVHVDEGETWHPILSAEFPTGLGQVWNGEEMQSFSIEDWDKHTPRDSNLVLFLWAGGPHGIEPGDMGFDSVSVKRRNQTPSDLLLSPAAVTENSPAGTVIGRLKAIDPDDPDGLDSYQFAFVGPSGPTAPNDNGLFELDGEFILAKVVLDHEESSERVIRVRVTDDKGGVLEKDLVIRVIDRREQMAEEQESGQIPEEKELPGWIHDAQPVEDGWFHSQWFGAFHRVNDKWMFHADLGWLSAVDDGAGGVWLWDREYGWLWTRRDVFPHLYHHEGADWLYFIREAGARRAFFNHAIQSIEFR